MLIFAPNRRTRNRFVFTEVVIKLFLISYADSFFRSIGILGYLFCWIRAGVFGMSGMFWEGTLRINVRLQEFLRKLEKVLGCTHADSVQET